MMIAPPRPGPPVVCPCFGFDRLSFFEDVGDLFVLPDSTKAKKITFVSRSQDGVDDRQWRPAGGGAVGISGIWFSPFQKSFRDPSRSFGLKDSRVFVSSSWGPLAVSFTQYPWNPLVRGTGGELMASSPNFNSIIYIDISLYLNYNFIV